MKKSNYILDEQLLGVPHSLFNGSNGYESQEFLLFISSLENVELKGLNNKGHRYFKQILDENLSGEQFYKNVIHPEDYPLFLHFLKSCEDLSPGEENETTVRVKSPFGYWKQFLFKNRLYSGMVKGDEKFVLSMARALDPYQKNFRKSSGANLETEKSLEESLNRYRVLVNSLDEGFCIIEIIFDLQKKPFDQLFVEINPAFIKHVRIPAPLGKTMKELSPNHGTHWFTTYANILATGEAVRFEEYAHDLQTWLDVYAFPIGTSKNRKVAILCTDITQRKQAEEDLKKMNEILEYKVRKRTKELKENSDLLQMVFDTVNQGIFLLKPYFGDNLDIVDFTYVRVNKRVKRYYKEEQMVGRRFLELNPQATRTGAFEIFKQTMLTGESKDFEVCFKRKGKSNWFRITTRRQKGFLINSLENITRKKQRTQTLKDSMRFKKQLIKTSPDIILIFNLYEEKVRFMNRGFMFNPKLSQDKVEGMPLMDILPLIHPQDREKAMQFHSQLLKASDKEIMDIEFRLKGPDHSWNYFNARGKVFMRNKKGNVYEYIILLRNVQEQKKTQQALINAEKLSIKGEIARTLAHELRNPLASIDISADILNKKIEGPARKKVSNYVKIIKRSTNTLNNLVTNLLTSSNYSPSVLKKCCLARTTNLALAQAKDRIYLTGIKVIRNFKGPYYINADKEKLKIALLNIIVNASEAMTPNEGILTIDIENLDKAFRLSISDNGCGMKPEEIDRLFESFYTNKVGGMGVGLSSVKNILDEHRALIEVKSEPNKGTTFILTFPAFESEQAKN